MLTVTLFYIISNYAPLQLPVVRFIGLRDACLYHLKPKPLAPARVVFTFATELERNSG